VKETCTSQYKCAVNGYTVCSVSSGHRQLSVIVPEFT